MNIIEVLQGILWDVVSVVLMLVFINVTYQNRYEKAAQHYVREQLNLFFTNFIACVISLYLYYFLESNFHIDRDYAGGILLVLFSLLSGVGGKQLYRIWFQRKQNRYTPTKEEYLVITSAVFIIVACRLVREGVVPLAVPCALLLGRFIWMDTTSLKEILDAVAVQHRRILESALLLAVGMIGISVVLFVFRLPNSAQPLLAGLYGIIVRYPVELLKAAFCKMHQHATKKKENR